jgi:hypothetical protein
MGPQGADDRADVGNTHFLQAGGPVFEQAFEGVRVVEGGGADLMAAAPAPRNSNASSAVAIPPRPMIGSSGKARATSQTIRKAIGALLTEDQHLARRTTWSDANGPGSVDTNRLRPGPLRIGPIFSLIGAGRGLIIGPRINGRLWTGSMAAGVGRR